MTESDVISSDAAPQTSGERRRRGGVSGMLLAELRELATTLGVPDTTGMRRGDLIAEIKKRQSGQDGDQLPLGDDAPANGARTAEAPAAEEQAPAAPSRRRAARRKPTTVAEESSPAVTAAGADAAPAVEPAVTDTAAGADAAPAVEPAVTDTAGGATGAPATEAADVTATTDAVPAAQDAAVATDGAAPAQEAPAHEAAAQGAPAQEAAASEAPTRGRSRRSARRDAGSPAGGSTTPETTTVPAAPETPAVSESPAAVEAPAEQTAPAESAPTTDQPSRRERSEGGGDRQDGRTDERRSDGGRSDERRSDERRSDERRSDERRSDSGRDDDGGGREGGGRRNGRGGDQNRDQREQRGNRSEGGPDTRERDEGGRRQNQGQQQGGPQNGNGQQNGPDDDDEDGGGRRRGRRFRDRRRNRNERGQGSGQGGGQGGGEPEVREDDVLIPVAGILDVLDNYAFVRTSGYMSGPNDVYVSLSLVRKHGLRRGDAVTGQVRQQRENEQNRQKFNPLVRVDTVNGLDPEAAKKRPEFTKLTPLYPNERLRLETESHLMSTRVIDLVMPVGKGQRALIVSPPKAGKTMVLQAIANAITTNNPEVHLMVVLVDERPEEVTDMQRTVKGEVIASTFDRPPSDHTSVAELSIERAKRLVEQGHDVVVLLDSITRLGRAYNLAAPASGRILSGGVDSTALYPPKRFLGAARNIEDGGSLTIFATALVETGSTMDTVIFEEFKGTGNAELKLDRKLADKRIFPAIDPDASSTRKEELLLAPDEMAVTHRLRRVLAALDSQQAIELVLDRLRKSRTNIEFLMQVAKTTPGKDDE